MAPGTDNKEWAQAADKARQAAVNVGEMARHATSAVGAMASQAACGLGKEADHLTENAGAAIEGLGERLSKNVPPSGMFGEDSKESTRARNIFNAAGAEDISSASEKSDDRKVLPALKG